MELRPGSVLAGSYRIVRTLGTGGMGAVYEVTHARLPCRYAIKILNPDLCSSTEAHARFQREAEVLSTLRHPNIVQVVDFNITSDGAPYLVMEYLEGRDLGSRLQVEGPLPLAQVSALVKQVAGALAAAHGQGVVHRDLKPQNVYLTRVAGQDDDFVKILDFGISKVRTAPRNLTKGRLVFGTPQYMSPEQAQGRMVEIDARTDQFALAAMTFEMLTGCDAFGGDEPLAVLFAVVHERPRSMAGLTLFDAAPVESVVLRGLDKDRRKRYASILDFSRALQGVAESAGCAAAARPAPAPAHAASDGHLSRCEPAGDGPAKLPEWVVAAEDDEPLTIPRSRGARLGLALVAALVLAAAGLFIASPARGRAALAWALPSLRPKPLPAAVPPSAADPVPASAAAPSPVAGPPPAPPPAPEPAAAVAPDVQPGDDHAPPPDSERKGGRRRGRGLGRHASASAVRQVARPQATPQAQPADGESQASPAPDPLPETVTPPPAVPPPAPSVAPRLMKGEDL